MNIVVLAGGLSTERDVSLITGNKVANALRKNGHNVILLDVFLGYLNEDADISNIFEISKEVSAKADGIKENAPDIEEVKAMREGKSANFFGPNVIKICSMADIVFMALHGENGENGKVQAVFDLFGIKYTGSGYLSSALAMDKKISKKLFIESHIPTPDGIELNKNSESDKAKLDKITYPCVVKPCSGGSSVGVSIVNCKEELDKALKDAFSYEEEILIEKYIKGREFSVGVINNKALPIIEIAPIEGFYDYKNKYKAGSAEETCPANLDENITHKMQKYAEEVCKVLGLNTYARMDFLLDKDNNMYCLEANTLPGMTPTSLLPQEAKAIGMSFEELCEKIIEISLKK